jgi:alpha,alpha-trehalase
MRMKKLTTILVVLVLTLHASAQKTVQTPAEVYGDLFTDVQMNHIFPDSKTFPDCIPKRNPKEIVRDYRAMTHNPNIKFSLELFVKENFDLPRTPQLNYITKEKDVVMHVKNLWNVLRRDADITSPSGGGKEGNSLLPLPNPYIVPGGRFREIYYWDSYFTMLGLKESGEVGMIENMVKNFAYLINTYGHIPNGNRSYYISRSQPPFFSLMVELLASIKGDKIYATYLSAMEKEYKFWMDGAERLSAGSGGKPGQAFRRVVRLKDGTILNRYWDDAATPRPEGFKEDVEVAEKSGRNKQEMYRNLRAGAESGMDFSNRWFADDKSITSIEVIDIIPVDLNALLYHLEKTIEKAYSVTRNEAGRKKYASKSMTRFNAIRKYCNNSSIGFYCDYNWKKEKISNKVTPAGMYPLCFFDLYPESEKAMGESAAKVIREKLLRDGGVVTTENSAGQQWDSPNGWAPHEWMTIWGLEQSGQSALARDIAQRWVKLNSDVFDRTGKLMEKYNVVDTRLEAGGGEYPGQDGFGWTNGVLLALIKKYQLHPKD